MSEIKANIVQGNIKVSVSQNVVKAIVKDAGPQGLTGSTGPGIATGGTAGQILKKNSGTNFDTTWQDQTDNEGYSPTWSGSILPPSKNALFSKIESLTLDNLADTVISSPTLDQILKWDGFEWINADNAASGGSGTSNSITVDQIAHGFVVGDILKSSGVANTYAKAQANSAVNAEVVGIVTTVTNANKFTLTTEGIVTTGVPSASAGTVFFLSPTSAGALTATEPTTIGQVSKPIAIILESSVRMLFHNFRGLILTSTGGGGGGSPLTIEEIDGSPSVANVTLLKVTNGTLTDNGGGIVSLNVGTGSSLTVEEVDGSPSVASITKIRVTNGTLTNDGGGQVTITTGGGGGIGDLVGPSSATDNALVRFDTTTGKLVQNSGVLLSDTNNISGLGTISSGAITSTGASSLGSLVLTTDLAVLDGGTGASSVSGARSNLNVQVKVFYTVGPTDADYIVDGTADQTEINSAITAANSAGGGVVRLQPAVTYSVNASITMLSNVILEGGGLSTIIKVANGTNSTAMHVIQANAKSNFIIKDLQIDGNKSNQSAGGHGIRPDNGCINMLLENLYIHDMTLHGIVMKETSSVYHDKITMNKIRVENCGTSADGSGIYLGNTTDIHLSDIFSSGHQLDGVQWKTSDHIELSNITTYNNSRYGIYAIGGHANINTISSYNNNIGINIEYDDINILNTTANLSNIESFSNQADGIRIADCSYIGLLNVKSWNNGQGGTTSAGLKLTAATAHSVTHVRVSNSAFFDLQGSPTQDFGIWGSGSGTVDLNKISDSECFGNSTTQFRTDTWSITNQVQNVQGFNPMVILNHGTLGATKTFDRVNGHYQVFTMGADMTMTLTGGKQRGDELTLQITQDATGSRLMTWPANFKKAGGTLTLSTDASAVDIVKMLWDGSNWREVSRAIGGA